MCSWEMNPFPHRFGVYSKHLAKKWRTKACRGVVKKCMSPLNDDGSAISEAVEPRDAKPPASSAREPISVPDNTS